jgi:hypothetical protein
MEVETSFGAETSGSAEAGLDGKVKAAPGEATDGLTLDVTGAKDPPSSETPKTEEGKEEAKAPEGDKPKDAALPKEPPAPPLEDLGEYKADDPAIVAKFDERFFTADAKLNKDALSAEFWGNENKLKDSTYAYLSDRLGVTQELVKEIEAGLVLKHTQDASGATTAAHAAAGGKEAYEAAIAWGLAGGYTEAQRARFDEAITKRAEGWEDAVVALVSRHQAATGGGRKMPNLLGRRSTPARDATNESKPGVAPGGPATPAAVEPFASRADWMTALKEAGNDPRKNAAVRARLRVSPFTRSAQ